MTLFKGFGIKAIAVLDFETTGLDPETDFPTEIGIVKVTNGSLGEAVITEYSRKIKLPKDVTIPPFITKLTGLTDEVLERDGFDINNLIYDVEDLLDDETLVVGHNVNFDLGFLYEHFGISPRHFMCTRTIEILTAPHLNASLKNVHPRYYPEATKEQTHRALGDCVMTLEVLEAQIKLIGLQEMLFFKNKLVNMPDRQLSFLPIGANVLDFSEKYVSERKHNELNEAFQILNIEVDSCKDDSLKLRKLEAYGVDNWSGYGDAMSDSEGIFEDE